MIAMIAMSAAFSLTGAPFDGPVAGLRVGMVNGEYQAFLPNEKYDKGELDLVVAGTETGIMMVEAGANEVSEDTIIEAIAWAQENMQPAINVQKELVKMVGVKEQEFELDLPNESVQDEVNTWVDGKLGHNLRVAYPERNEMVNSLRNDFHEALEDKYGEEVYKEIKKEYDEAFTLAVHKDVRKGIVEDETRPDGRKLNEIRQLSSEIGLLPRVHGSSIFTRGN